MNKIKVSFDFDSTLDRVDVQHYAKSLINKGYSVYIITSRFDNITARENGWWWIEKTNDELFNISDDCGINRDNIIFTCSDDKIIHLKNNNFIFHLDDDLIEIGLIEEDNEESCKGVWTEDYIPWEKTCNESINKYI